MSFLKSLSPGDNSHRVIELWLTMWQKLVFCTSVNLTKHYKVILEKSHLNVAYVKVIFYIWYFNCLRSYKGEKPFKCKFCKNIFSTSSSLSIHKKCHTRENSLKCYFYEKVFSTHLVIKKTMIKTLKMWHMCKGNLHIW